MSTEQLQELAAQPGVQEGARWLVSKQFSDIAEGDFKVRVRGTPGGYYVGSNEWDELAMLALAATPAEASEGASDGN